MNKRNDKTRLHLNRKTLVVVSILTISLLCLFSLFTLLTTREKTKSDGRRKPTIALVNEDMMSTFNTQEYTFGKNFVDLVSDDQQYNWQVVSRSVADRAYKDGSVDAVIYLPQTFSKDLLTLQNLNPTKAKIDYKIQQQKDDLSEKILQNKLMSCLYLFNKNVVKMYYASVAGNIAEADNQMKQTVSKQADLVLGLSNQVQSPFKNSMSNYDTFISGTNGLKGLNQANVALQNSFTDSTKMLMAQTGERFTSQLPQLTTYFDTQKKIAKINVDNGNQGIKNQARTDQDFYFSQFDNLNTSLVNQLSALSSKDLADKEIGQLPELTQQIKTYNQLIVAVRGDISDQITTLTNSRTDLLDLENNLYDQFFDAEVSATVENFDNLSDSQKDDNKIRQALANKIKTSLSKTDNLSDSPYLDKVAQQISSISLDVAEYKLDSLLDMGMIDFDTKCKIEAQLKVINQYATAFELGGGTVMLSDAKTLEASDQTMTRKMTITVPAGMTYQSSAFPANVRISPVTKTGITVSRDNRIVLANPLPTTADEAKEKETPKRFDVDLHITLADDQSLSLATTWLNQLTNEKVFETTDHFVLLPKPGLANTTQDAQENLQEIMSWFSKIDGISSMITTLYADPSEDYTSLLSVLTQEEFKNQSQRSVFNMYGNIDVNELSKRLSNQDVQAFKMMGQENLSKVIAAIKSINTAMSSLGADEQRLQDNLPEQYFEENLKALTLWYTQTIEMLARLYQGWQIQDPTMLEVKEWADYDRTKTELFVDSSTVLYEQIQKLVTSTTQATQEISKNAQAVKDNSEQFNQLVNQATLTQKDAKNLLANTDNLVLTGNEEASQVKGFYDAFSKTLANTRTPGVNTQYLYSFFANPILTNDITPEKDKMSTDKKTVLLPLALLFVMGLITGVLLLLIGQLIRKKMRDSKTR